MIVVLLVLAIGMAPAGGSAQETTEQPTQKLSKKKFRTLIANARIPEEHARMASWYRADAVRLNEKQKEREREAQEYFKNPSRLRFRSGRPTDSIAKTWRLTTKRKRGRNSPSLTYMN